MSVKEEGRGGGSELGSDLDLDPDLWKISWIRIRQNDADPLDPDLDPQHWYKTPIFSVFGIVTCTAQKPHIIIKHQK